MLRSVLTYFGFYSGEEAASGDGRKRSTCWKALGNPAFRRYFAGSVTSDLGTWLANTAQLLLAYRLSHSVLVVGLVTCAQFSSPLLLGPWAGVMTDWLGARRMLLTTQLLGAAIATGMASSVFAGAISPWVLAAGAIFSGLAFTLALPARNVTVRCLVTKADLEPAFAMDSVSYNLGRTIGPPLTVALVMLCGGGFSGYGWAFAANAVSFLIFSGCLILAGKGSPEPPRVRSRFRTGLSAARGDWNVQVLLAMVAAVTIADDPILVLGPTLAHSKQILHGLPAWGGHWLSAGSLPGLFLAALGAGTVIGSLRPSRHKASLRTSATALAVLAVCMMTFVFSRWWWLSLATAAGAGITCLSANSTTKALLSTRVRAEQEAGVMAVWAIAWAGSKPVASLCDGFLASLVGPQLTGFILAIPALVPFLVMIALMIMVYAEVNPDHWTGLPAKWATLPKWVFRARGYLTSADSDAVDTRATAFTNVN